MSDPVFKPIGEEVEQLNLKEAGLTELDSICAECRKEGKTRLLLTEIPFYKQVVVISFNCEHCGFSNNELQPASEIQEKAIIYTVKCENLNDLNRRVVKTEWAEIRIPEVDFEVKKQTGLITTIEGIIDRAIQGLRSTVTNTPHLAPTDVVKISNFVLSLEKLKKGDQPFTFILDDPTGNSFVENLKAPQNDPQIEIRHYARSLEQNKLIGIVPDDITEDPSPLLDSLSQKQEVLQFPTICAECKSNCFTNMKVTNIPHFKEIVLMVTLCEKCGYKTNEIKSGGAIEEKGVRYTKKVNSDQDLSIDLVRSDTCSVEIPELEFKLESSGTGQYTTIEGLVKAMKEQLKNSNPFFEGDSEDAKMRTKYSEFLNKLDNIIGLTVILDDPCGNSFIEQPDKIEHYERTNEQNEELGLNDMKTENY